MMMMITTGLSTLKIIAQRDRLVFILTISIMTAVMMMRIMMTTKMGYQMKMNLKQVATHLT